MAGDVTAISIAPFVPADRDGVAQLYLVGIERGEFGIAITYDDEPDSRTSRASTRPATGNSRVARSGAAIVGRSR